MMHLLGFIQESNKIEGILSAVNYKEIEAYRKFLKLDIITVKDLEEFVSFVQPNAELRRRVGLDVRVGNHVAPPGGHNIEIQLNIILNNLKHLGSYNTHLVYETLHPFTDGNGRSGRALWLWQMGGEAPLGFLHQFYYQTLDAVRE